MSTEPGEISAQLVASSTTGYVIDDEGAGFFMSPVWAELLVGGYQGDFRYVAPGSGSSYAQWKPDLYGGWYEVLVHYYADPTHYDKAQYTVYYYGGTRTVAVNQQLKADGLAGPGDSGWLSLGVFRFLGGTSGYVRLTNATAAGGAGLWVIADAVKFSPLEVWVDDDYTQFSHEGRTWGVNAFNNIQEALLAVGNLGTINVKPGTYVGPIAITKGITLTSTGGAASTTITATTGTAVQVLADGVMVNGFTVRSHAATRGIANYDESAPAWIPIHSYRILNNVVRSFAQGVEFYQAKGEISSNTIYSNTDHGIFVQETLPSDPGPTTIRSNVLYGNGAGGGAADYDIEVWKSYTGTIVMSNTITGSGVAGESCILVLDQAGSLDVTGNTLTGCNEGVYILNNGAANVIQKVNLCRNVISGGTKGVRVRNNGGNYDIRQILIGGSLANSNRIFGNSGYELELVAYSADFTATYNYWGVCTWRAIEDEIRHDYDAGALGKVVYEPALCVPANINVEARPATIPADGISTATITVTVTDIKGDPALAGTMIGVTTTLGSVPYGYVEAEGAEVIRTPGWNLGANALASAGQFMGLPAPGVGESMDWVFTGTAVSVVYMKWPGAGLADVYVDSMASPLKTIDMATAVGTGEWLVEEVITTALSATGVHTISVRMNAGSPGTIYVDAFRSGGTVVAQGRIVTSLTSVPVSDTATVWASVYNGRIYLNAAPAPPYDVVPVLQRNADVAFQGTDVYITKAASQSQVSPGKKITYTITYGNLGPARAKGVVITDTLPLDFQYVSHKTSPTLPAPTVSEGITIVWTVGELAPSARGYITVVAQPNAGLPWPSTPSTRVNSVDIHSVIRDDAAGNDSFAEPVDVVPNPAAAITVTTYPTAIPADGAATAVITAEVRDAYNNPVLDGTAITFTTNLPGTIFQPGGTQTHLGTTTGGVATTILQAGTTAGKATITVKVTGPALPPLQGTGEVQLLALEPYSVTMSANPWAIPVSHGTEFSTLRITVTDQYRNLVHGAAVTLTTDAGALAATGVVTGTEIVVVTSNGITTAKLSSTETVQTATVTAAITTTGRPPATAEVYFKAALPYTITLDVWPTALVVCGEEAMITATIQDEFGNPVEDGTAVYFDVIPATAGEMRYRSMLTVNGVATSTVRTKAYTMTSPALEVVVTAGRISRRFSVNLAAGPPAQISFRMSPPAIPACGGVAEVEATVRDCAGNRVANGTVITFSVAAPATGVVPEVTSTSNGEAYTVVSSGSLAGSAVLTAEVGFVGLVRTFVVVIDPGPADVIYMAISPAAIFNCGGGTAVVTATLRDACNNLVKDGTPVVFGPTYGYVGLSRYSGFTQNGIVTTTATANQEKPIHPSDWPWGLEQVYAYSGAALQAFQNLWIRPGAPARIDVSANPEQIQILGDVNGYDIIVVADVADCSGTAVEDGTLVTLRTSKGFFRESGQFWVEQMAFGGQVTGTLTSREIAGEVLITATSGSAIGTADAFFLPDPPAYVEVWAVPAAIPADGHSQSTVYVKIRDAFNNLVGPGITVTFTTARGQFSNGNLTYTTYTLADGMALARLTADTTPGTVIVLAETYNGVSGWFDVTFTVPPVYRYIYLPNVYRRRILP